MEWEYHIVTSISSVPYDVVTLRGCMYTDTVDETETEVQGYEGSCEFLRLVRYVDNDNPVDISQLIPLVDSSTSCRQLVKWRCHQATINSPNSPSGDAQMLTYWRNRDGDNMAYWGGATPVAVGRCAFFLTLYFFFLPYLGAVAWWRNW